jgi:hypothetical protein
MAGKGSKPRPYSVTQDEYSANWDLIFKRDKVKTAEPVKVVTKPSKPHVK